MLLYNSFKMEVRDTNAGRRKLKFGDAVRIKDYETVREVKNRGYEFPGHFSELMERYCGKKAIIVRIEYLSEKFYRLDIDGLDWLWSEDMFDLSERHMVMESE